MVFPDTVLLSVKEAIKQSGRLPDATTYAVFELDEDGGQSDVYPPIVEITTSDTIRGTTVNTDFVGYSTDANGNHIGQLYRAPFEMPIQIDCVTAEGDGYDPNEMAREVRLALYEYEDRQDDRALPDPNSTGILDDVTRFQLSEGEPNNDLGMTPAMRRWRQSATVWFEEVIDTAEEYGHKDFIETVHLPGDGDPEGGTDIEIVLDATPNTVSPADDHT